MPYAKKVAVKMKLQALTERRKTLDQQIADMVGVATSYDAWGKPLMTWAEVGESLGVTRQAAWERYRGIH